MLSRHSTAMSSWISTTSGLYGAGTMTLSADSIVLSLDTVVSTWFDHTISQATPVTSEAEVESRLFLRLTSSTHA
jgi:hypothetical protein